MMTLLQTQLAAWEARSMEGGERKEGKMETKVASRQKAKRQTPRTHQPLSLERERATRRTPWHPAGSV
jgi:hypothetical protein